ncbi:MAG: DNA-binding response regulator [Candidatus Marinarcus sp.]|uniref:DNA-binding response regulator n=1 Tax=Candidatus Marinarcus sp. TaxID=3100987 RepID=UPI003B001BA2
MNILIIENEVYLAQKVVSRLLDDGHSCVYAEGPNAVPDSIDFDTVLLSTSMPSLNYNEIIKKFEHSIVILLVSYISDETVTDPIKAGAKDYIMKPFIMDELLRKIYHFKDCRQLKQELQTMRNYLDFIFRDIDLSESNVVVELPLLIETNSQKCVDKIAFEFSYKLNLPIKFISLAKDNWQKEIQANKNKELLYLTDYHTLKKSSKDNLNALIETKKCLICSLESENEFPYNKTRVKKTDMVVINDNIMTINDYVKLMVVSFQGKYPDTELSKKLGISRKSLWEKRKKLNIEKKK